MLAEPSSRSRKKQHERGGVERAIAIALQFWTWSNRLLISFSPAGMPGLRIDLYSIRKHRKEQKKKKKRWIV
jgi:hypothetical protein